jgi:hypothetical protein
MARVEMWDTKGRATQTVAWHPDVPTNIADISVEVYTDMGISRNEYVARAFELYNAHWKGLKLG